MQLMIKQRVFTWGDTYDVYDESGEARYFVKAEIFTFGHQIHVYDKRSGREVGSVHQKLFTMLPAVEIVIGGQTRGEVRREFSFFTQRYHVDYLGWEVEGDCFHWDYDVTCGQNRVLSISRQLLTWGDTYILEYNNIDYEIPGLLLAIAIDAANCNND